MNSRIRRSAYSSGLGALGFEVLGPRSKLPGQGLDQGCNLGPKMGIFTYFSAFGIGMGAYTALMGAR